MNYSVFKSKVVKRVHKIYPVESYCRSNAPRLIGNIDDIIADEWRTTFLPNVTDAMAMECAELRVCSYVASVIAGEPMTEQGIKNDSYDARLVDGRAEKPSSLAKKIDAALEGLIARTEEKRTILVWTQKARMPKKGIWEIITGFSYQCEEETVVSSQAHVIFEIKVKNKLSANQIAACLASLVHAQYCETDPRN